MIPFVRRRQVTIDLHTHSTASDGTLTPAELMAAGAAAGLDVVAITDHDTTAGWAAAAAALPPGCTLVRGRRAVLPVVRRGAGDPAAPAGVPLRPGRRRDLVAELARVRARG